MAPPAPTSPSRAATGASPPSGLARPYTPTHHVRIVTATSLFDGHDAAINIMRRILQASGAEVIHLGHNRSVAEIVDCAIQEDVQGIAITSYQGGHVEFFTYMVDLLRARNANIRVFGGGGGTILPSEIAELHARGVARIYSPDDGRALGLQGMIDDLLRQCDFPTRGPELDASFAALATRPDVGSASLPDPAPVAALITIAENHPAAHSALHARLTTLIADRVVPVLGVTGTGGAGKSSLVDEIVRRFLAATTDETIAVLSVDPSKRRSGGALLGDRIRMNSVDHPRVFMRSLATRQSNLAISAHIRDAIDVCRAAGFSLVLVETSGIGQSDTAIVDHCDVSLYVMTAEYGAATQLEKIDMLDFADLVAINKFDKAGALDALRDVRKQVRRNRQLWTVEDEALPVFPTIASQFNDPGTSALYARVASTIAAKTGVEFGILQALPAPSNPPRVLPAARVRYLAEIADANEQYAATSRQDAGRARRCFQIAGTIAALRGGDLDPGVVLPDLTADPSDPAEVAALLRLYADTLARLDHATQEALRSWPATQARYAAETYSFDVRGRTLSQPLIHRSLAGTPVRRVSLPQLSDWGDLLLFLRHENVPGSFPFAAGVFPLKRQGESPARQFAGEGGPERTNRRFHYLSWGVPAKRLSTAFDSVTLYGEDPDARPDIYGKVGNSGVSVASLDDAKKLYSGFDLCDPATSVSMTINGPAPIVLGFFLNAAVDQQCEKELARLGRLDDVEAALARTFDARGLPRPAYRGERPEGNDGLGLLLLGLGGRDVLPEEAVERIEADTLRQVRGTVQADILKEDQAQNTCIFSTEFALRMMGDIQEHFIAHGVKNFYSVSISGYHIAEAGANPITQLAFTLANGLTFVEYYLARGMAVDDFAGNLSFFFSNGLDPEYTVIGRVARRIWAKAMKHRYGADERSQLLKYHVQTSGRSLHAQEIAFNDIRTTLQALLALMDNCNSLHTNAYDEAITTPTEESVRRALAIQLIINQEFGLSMNENPLQGSYAVQELTDLVEAAVLEEFRRLSERGGVLGAMERQYQRSRIQEESLLYEKKKHTGELPIVGVNTFLDRQGSPTIIPDEVIRSTTEEKDAAIASRDAVQRRNAERAPVALRRLGDLALSGGNLFEGLMEATRVCTLGQISGALYAVGGQYRRNM